MTTGPFTITAGAQADQGEVVRRLVTERLDSSYRLAAVLLGDRYLAEEATHDAVVRALRSAAKLRDLHSFDAWFRRILVNACRDAGKRRRATAAEPLDDAPLPQLGDDPTHAWVEYEAVRRSLRGLSREHQEVVVLRFFADLPLEAIAESTGLRMGTVKSRLHYALKHLRAEYEAAARRTPEGSR